jgi:hypothetical protein
MGHARHIGRAPGTSTIAPIATESLRCDTRRCGPVSDIKKYSKWRAPSMPSIVLLFSTSAAPAANGPRKGLSPPNIAIQHNLTSCPRHADTGRIRKEGYS